MHRVVVPGYFHGDKRPTLLSPEGAPLDPTVFEVLTGHTAYAQAGNPPAAKVVGHVAKMTGSASVSSPYCDSGKARFTLNHTRIEIEGLFSCGLA